jgi:predicted lipoprotein with Yx(FWY)xxD motif
MTARLLAVTLALSLSLLTACGDDPGRDADAPVPTSGDQTTDRTAGTPTKQPTSEPTGVPTKSKSREPDARDTRIVGADSEFGTILFDGTGQAIYVFDVETTSRPDCYDACAEAWPPVLTAGNPVAGAGVRASLLGTTERTDGRTQVTYNDHPLYFYAHEGKHEVECHDVFLNGGNWYAVQPDGNAAPAA